MLTTEPTPTVKTPTRVYVAGPYSKGGEAANVRSAIIAADRLWAAGLVPFVPHLTHFRDLLTPRPYAEWCDYDRHWVALCDCVLRLPGESAGADAEVALARELGKAVYGSVEECVAELLPDAKRDRPAAGEPADSYPRYWRDRRGQVWRKLAKLTPTQFRAGDGTWRATENPHDEPREDNGIFRCSAADAGIPARPVDSPPDLQSQVAVLTAQLAEAEERGRAAARELERIHRGDAPDLPADIGDPFTLAELGEMGVGDLIEEYRHRVGPLSEPAAEMMPVGTRATLVDALRPFAADARPDAVQPFEPAIAPAATPVPAAGNLPARGTRWRHSRTGRVYRVLHVATDEGTRDKRVIYEPTTGQPRLWNRLASEFMDGRFVPVIDPEPTTDQDRLAAALTPDGLAAMRSLPLQPPSTADRLTQNRIVHALANRLGLTLAATDAGRECLVEMLAPELATGNADCVPDDSGNVPKPAAPPTALTPGQRFKPPEDARAAPLAADDIGRRFAERAVSDAGSGRQVIRGGPQAYSTVEVVEGKKDVRVTLAPLINAAVAEATANRDATIAKLCADLAGAERRAADAASAERAACIHDAQLESMTWPGDGRRSEDVGRQIVGAIIARTAVLKGVPHAD